MSGRPATMFRPEIINQLRVLEFAFQAIAPARTRQKTHLVRDVFTLIELADYAHDCKGGGIFR
jgi:hypothetical protein